jgi:acyl CoA:acetate/3-ketoacid CoA transferase
MPLTERTVIARRAARAIEKGSVVNLGYGIPDGVARVLAEQGRLDDVVLTVEQGLSGGMPATGIIFGAVWNPDSLVDAPSQFDLYDGGALDVACLGFAQIDRDGNVNVSKVGDSVIGIGGFINISAAARLLIFCGTFTSGGLRTSVADGRIQIVQEGSHKKFVAEVDQMSFNASQARSRGPRVIYVTERAVFELVESGILLTEIAPGVDLDREVLANIEVRPSIREPLGLMDPSLFERIYQEGVSVANIGQTSF